MLSNSGSAASSYGFTGEWTENGLVYLRARYYLSYNGRFITKDSWQGNYARPLSLNLWNYVEANPINFRDSSGFITEDEAKGVGVA